MNQKSQLETSSQANLNSKETKFYAPGFIDRVMAKIKRLPMPYWLTYLLLFFLQSVISQILAWIMSAVPVFTFYPLALLFPLWLWGPLAIMTYLNSVAHKAFLNFSPLLDMDSQELETLDYEFTTMPNKGVLLSSFFWSIIYAILNYVSFDAFLRPFGPGSLFMWFILVQGLASFFIGSAIYYHSLRHIRLVSHTVKQVKHFNLFQLEPVYSFSRLTSRTGIFWMILLSLTLVIVPYQSVNAAILAVWAIIVAFALAAFVLPLKFVNNQLVAEKRKLLAALDRRNEQILLRIHRSLDEDKIPEVTQLNNALTGLNTEFNILNRIPTWPWRSSTLTSLLSAIVLPIIIFLIQLAIKNLLGE